MLRSDAGSVGADGGVRVDLHLFFFEECPADESGSLRGVIGVGTAH